MELEGEESERGREGEGEGGMKKGDRGGRGNWDEAERKVRGEVGK